MKLAIRNKRDFWSGLMFTAFGAAFAVLALEYEMGTAALMGPGWFPVALGSILAVIGLLITAGSFHWRAEQTDIETIGWRELLLILLAIGVFAWLLPHLGVVLSVMLLVFVAALAGHERRPLETLIVAVALAAVCYGLFVAGLGLPLPIWPTLPEG